MPEKRQIYAIYFFNKVYFNNTICFGGGDIVNKVTLQFTLPTYSPLNLPNTSIYKENARHQRVSATAGH